MAIVEDIGKIIKEISPYYKKKGEPSKEFKLVYDSSSEGLEPLYFWILDFTKGLFSEVEKPLDNFTSSPGSGHFGELGQRASIMQQQGTKLLADINTVLKSIMNIIYDLKEFEIRLKQYEQAHSKNKIEAEAGLLALKQVWLDNVDVKRGRGSIHMMAQDLNFVTARDAFYVANTLEGIDKLDLNERVKRLLKPRLAEFLEWRKLSETELKKRFEIEKTYLKSQLSAVQLYSRWAKPYLRAAAQLNPSETSRPEVVNVFNTMYLELTLLGKSEIKPAEAAVAKEIPEEFKTVKLKRKYYACVVIDFNFRGIPQKTGQHFTFGGRSEVDFKAYALNEQEIKLLNARLKKTDLNDALKLVEGVTTESLEQLKEDIDYFLKSEDERKKEQSDKRASDDINPFLALFGFGTKKKKATTKEEEKEQEDKEIEKLEKGIKKDNYTESIIRALAEKDSINKCFTIFDVYKKGHGMASVPFEDALLNPLETSNPKADWTSAFGRFKQQ